MVAILLFCEHFAIPAVFCFFGDLGDLEWFLLKSVLIIFCVDEKFGLLLLSNSVFWSIRSIFVMDLELLNFELLNDC